jgi:hypothetical protein
MARAIRFAGRPKASETVQKQVPVVLAVLPLCNNRPVIAQNV